MIRATARIALITLALVVSGAVAAHAGTASYPGVGSTSGQVIVQATIRPHIVLEIQTPQTEPGVGFGAVDPGVATASQAVDLIVWSNRTFQMTRTTTGAASIGLSTTLADSSDNPKTVGALFTDVYSLNVPMATDPGDYAATVEYTVVQQ